MKKKRRVLISGNWEGITYNIQTKALAEELSSLNDVLYISQGNINAKELKINDGLKVIQWPTRRAVTLKDAFFFFKKTVFKKPDILIVHYDATVLCLIISWLLRVKYRIGWIHTSTQMYSLDVANKKKVKGIFSRRKYIYRLATHVVVMTEFSKQDVLVNYDIAENKIIKIPNGIFSAPLVAQQNDASIRYVGRLDYSKGVDTLLKAFKKLASINNKLKLEIVGKGEDMQNLKSFVEKENLSGSVVFHGYWRDYEKVRKFIAGAYFIVLPTRADNFPTVILEAFSSGIPVIASGVGGIPEMFTNGKEGFLIENENEYDFADAMQKLTENKNLRRKMSEQAKKTFDENFTMQNHILNVKFFLNTLQ